MGLFDWSRPAKPLESEDLRRMGRLEARLESIELQWASYRDELKRLVNRIEKRDQRAEARAEREAAEAEAGEPEFPALDATSARIHARRNAMRGRGANGLSE
jgi:hypothetical protein